MWVVSEVVRIEAPGTDSEPDVVRKQLQCHAGRRNPVERRDVTAAGLDGRETGGNGSVSELSGQHHQANGP